MKSECLELYKKPDKNPGAWAIIYCPERDSFLMGQRSESARNSGMWNFFGGRIDGTETCVDALLREVHEEMGLDVTEDRKVEYGPILRSAPVSLGAIEQARHYHFFLLPFDREISPTLNREHCASRWFRTHEIPRALTKSAKFALEHGFLDRTRLMVGVSQSLCTASR